MGATKWNRGVFALLFIGVPIVLLINILSLPVVNSQVFAPGNCPIAPAMKYLNVSRYTGKWYEVEKYWFLFEATSKCVTVRYFDKLAVEIKQLDMFTGKIYTNPGTTRFLREEGNGDVILDLLITQSPVAFSFPYRYKILDTDYTSYTIKYSCNQVGPLNYQGLWILGRQKYFSPETRRKIYYTLETMGIKSNLLKHADQTSCPF